MKSLLLFIFCLLSYQAVGQGLNNLWMMGYDSWAGLPFGATDINFQMGSASTSYQSRAMNISRTFTNITNQNNELQFYTNGIFIANRTGAPMQNGVGLNPSWFTDNNTQYGLPISQAALIIPKPNDPDIYFLFHSTADEPDYQAAKSLYLTTINMQLAGGLGAVIDKNQPLINNSLNTGKITAIKHGNGRDWWIFCHKANSAIYYRLLVTPQGIFGPVEQQIGSIRPPDVGQAVFSPDGSRFAYYYPASGLDIMYFDRCSGHFSNPTHIVVSDTSFDGGVAFSQNSEFLYVSSVYRVYQFNLSAIDIASSMQTIGVWDGFHDPASTLARTLFFKSQLAPDGKIYISTGNSTRYLHVINNPDNSGLGCNFIQHELVLPSFNFNSFPNHPNYHLGPLVGSSCDTLTSSTDLVKGIALQLYPNPNSGEFSLSFAPQPELGQLQVYDVLGKLVHQEVVAQWSQVKRLLLPQLKQGVYHCRMSWGEKSGVVRFVKN